MAVLIVEDDPPALEVLRLMIPRRFPDFRIHLAGDGSAGWEQCLRCQPDIVITDVDMPGMDGLRLTAMIKAWRKRTRVIVLTGYSDPDHLERIRAAGADGYVAKPVDFAKVYDEIGWCLEELGQIDAPAPDPG